MELFVLTEEEFQSILIDRVALTFQTDYMMKYLKMGT